MNTESTPTPKSKAGDTEKVTPMQKPRLTKAILHGLHAAVINCPLAWDLEVRADSAPDDVANLDQACRWVVRMLAWRELRREAQELLKRPAYMNTP